MLFIMLGLMKVVFKCIYNKFFEQLSFVFCRFVLSILSPKLVLSFQNSFASQLFVVPLI